MTPPRRSSLSTRRDDVPPTESLQDLRTRMRAVNRAFPSGVAVVSTLIHDKPHGLAVNAFSSVSLEPPLVLVCVNTAAQTHEHLYTGRFIGISFLAHDQAAVASVFAISGGDKFAGIGWHRGSTDAPLIDNAAGYLEAAVEQRHSAGTHTIFVGRVVEADATRRAPLIYLNGSFYDGAELPTRKLG